MSNQHFDNVRRMLDEVTADTAGICRDALASSGDTAGLSAVERMLAPRGVPRGLTPGAPLAVKPKGVTPAVVPAWTPVDPWEDLVAPAGITAATPSSVSSELLTSVLSVYGVTTTSSHTAVGPTVTTFILGVPVGSKVSTVASRESDLARDLGVDSVRVLDRVPGHPGCIGCEIPNKVRTPVGFRNSLLDMPEPTEGMAPLVALGVDTSGRTTWRRLSDFPHLLVAGTTGSGKSVFLHSLICSVLARHTPDTVKLVLVDPKRVEFVAYSAVPHLARPVARTAGEAAEALDYLVATMESRYAMLESRGVSDICGYTAAGGTGMPYILAVVDEYSDLMMSGGKKSGVEDKIIRLAQMARAVGIHLVLATQKPTVDVVTGQIRSNMGARAVFRVSSATDSRVVLDTGGAESLLGKGDMLFSDASGVSRMQGVSVDSVTKAAVCRGGRCA